MDLMDNEMTIDEYQVVNHPKIGGKPAYAECFVECIEGEVRGNSGEEMVLKEGRSSASRSSSIGASTNTTYKRCSNAMEHSSRERLDFAPNRRRALFSTPPILMMPRVDKICNIPSSLQKRYVFPSCRQGRQVNSAHCR